VIRPVSNAIPRTLIAPTDPPAKRPSDYTEDVNIGSNEFNPLAKSETV